MKKQEVKNSYIRDWYLGAVKSEYLGEVVNLPKGETVQSEHSNGKVQIVFTNKRIIVLNKKDSLGEDAEEEFSLPYKSITMWSALRYERSGREEEFIIGTTNGEVAIKYLSREVADVFSSILVRECV